MVNEERRVLLVEDEALVAMVAEESLRGMGFDPVTVGTAGEALEAMASGGAMSVAMVDVGLPDMRGDALVLRIRQDAPEMPIILASGYDGAELRRRFEGDHMLRVLPKPYSEGQLRKTLADLDLSPTN